MELFMFVNNNDDIQVELSTTNNNMEYVVVIVGFCDSGQDLSELCAHLTISAEARNSILS